MSLKWHVAQRLELLWWKRYLGQKPPAEYLAWKRNYWKQFFKTLAPHIQIKETDSVFELGCGPAGCFIYFTKNKMVCVDPLIEMYEHSLQHFSRSSYPNVHFIAKPAEESTAKEKFDVVLCINALNHFRNMDVSLDVMHSNLAERGKLVLSVDVHKFNLLKWFFRLLPGDVLHPHQHSLNDYIKLLEKHNYKIDLVKKIKPGVIFDYVAIIATA